jgi:hypothetical protein
VTIAATRVGAFGLEEKIADEVQPHTRIDTAGYHRMAGVAQNSHDRAAAGCRFPGKCSTRSSAPVGAGGVSVDPQSVAVRRRPCLAGKTVAGHAV